MRIMVTDEAGVLCAARVDVERRRVRELSLDDADASAPMMGLSVLAGCIAAILEDVARGGKTLQQAARDHEKANAGELRTEVEL